MNKGRRIHIDHIWPRAEGGPNENWNKRRVSMKENLTKGARMPNLKEVSDSPNPIRLAVEIDKHTVKERLKHPSNKDRGFGGLHRLQL